MFFPSKAINLTKASAQYFPPFSFFSAISIFITFTSDINTAAAATKPFFSLSSLPSSFLTHYRKSGTAVLSSIGNGRHFLKVESRGSAFYLLTTPHVGSAGIKTFSTFSTSLINNLAAKQVAQSRKTVTSSQKGFRLNTGYTNFDPTLSIPAIDSTNTYSNGSLA